MTATGSSWRRWLSSCWPCRIRGVSDPGADANRYTLVTAYALASHVVLLLSLWMPVLRYLLDGLWLLACTDARVQPGREKPPSGRVPLIEPGLRYSYVSPQPYRVTTIAAIIAGRRPDCLIVNWTAKDGKDAILNPEGRISTVFTTAGAGCLVTQAICQKANPRIRFLIWLDDSYNRLLAEGVAGADSLEETA